jgi:hypothetical protein
MPPGPLTAEIAALFCGVSAASSAASSPVRPVNTRGGAGSCRGTGTSGPRGLLTASSVGAALSISWWSCWSAGLGSAPSSSASRSRIFS